MTEATSPIWRRRWRAGAPGPAAEGFVLPGATPAAGALDLARAVVRRAERCLVRLRRESGNEAGAGSQAGRYLNRLSLLLFVLGRFEEHRPASRPPRQTRVNWPGRRYQRHIYLAIGGPALVFADRLSGAVRGRVPAALRPRLPPGRSEDFRFTPWSSGRPRGVRPGSPPTGSPSGAGSCASPAPSDRGRQRRAQGPRQDTLAIAIALWRKGFNVLTYSIGGCRAAIAPR